MPKHAWTDERTHGWNTILNISRIYISVSVFFRITYSWTCDVFAEVDNVFFYDNWIARSLLVQSSQMVHQTKGDRLNFHQAVKTKYKF